VTRHSDPNLSREAAIEQAQRRFSAWGRTRARLRRTVLAAGWSAVLLLVPAAKRAFDLVSAGGLFLLILPVLLLAGAVLAVRGGPVLCRTACCGRWGVVFNLLTLATPPGRFGRALACTRLNQAPVLWNVVRGDLSLVGPRVAAVAALDPRDAAVRRRLCVRPGLVCLWWLRRRANIDYGGELVADVEYVEGRSFHGDLALLFRAVPALLYGAGVTAPPGRIRILGLTIDNLTMDEAVDAIRARLEPGSAPSLVCFVNPHCANIACRDPAYFRVLDRAGLCLADGIGMKLAGRLLGQPVRQNVNGTDLFPRLCEILAGTEKGLFLLGARPGVAEAVRDWVRQHYPNTVVSGVQHGYFSADDEPAVRRRIADSGAAVLLVAFGVPRQELWLQQHLVETGVRVGMGVGGLFDFYSGRIPRAPLWLREMGLEWVYRVIQEPRRMWKRYIVGNVAFLARVGLERLGLRRYPRAV
jgi:N-acetylglucosaminyldiphosphoundecaprenol N-acetyl-beta-D-mannosaminyltransferase